MKRLTRIASLSLSLLVACRGVEPVAAPALAAPTAAKQAPAASKPAAAAPIATVPEAPTVQQPSRPRIAATAELTRRVRALSDRARPLEAVELASRELAERCAAADWNDPMLLADSVVAALVLEDLLERSGAWREASYVLQRALPLHPNTPQELRAQLELVLARASVRMGRVGPARDWLNTHGTIRDWRLIGPFANERGGGFDAVYAPEEKIDLLASAKGKERDVAWRVHPCPQTPLGIVQLDAMLRPNTQAVAYLATALRVETPREVRLALGTSGEVKVWHGRRLALARKVQRSYHRDQEDVVLALEPGWNPILLKLGHEDVGGWLVSARLTELDGSPLSDAIFDSSHASDAVEAREPTATVPAGTRAMLESRGDDPRALALLAEWHMTMHPEDYSARTAKKLAERALALAPDDVATLYLVARANEPAEGEDASEIRHNERLMPLKRIVELEPAHAGAWLDLADFWTELNPLPYAAEDAARKALAAVPQSARALDAMARSQDGFGRDSEARMFDERASASAEGKLDPSRVVREAWKLVRRGERTAALGFLKTSIAAGRSDATLYSAAFGMAIEGGELETALEFAAGWNVRVPADLSMLLRCAEACEHFGKLDRARSYVESALAVCPESTEALRILARIEEREGDSAAACRTLDEVARLDPGLDLVRRQSALLAASTVQPERFEEPWRWDAVTRVGLLARSGNDNDPVQVVDRTTIWKVEPDGTERKYEHILLQVENSAGVKALDSYWIPYPSDATLQVYNVRVVHADGTFERAPAPRGGDAALNGQFVRGFDLPPLVPGDMVDIEFRVDPTEPDVFGQYFGERHAFQVDYPDALAPVRQAELVVIAPRDLKLYTFVHNAPDLEATVEERDGALVRRWVARDLKRPAMEGAMPGRSELVPLVDISTFESWQALASWWWGFIEKEFVTTQAMKDKVAELTAGLPTEEEKVRAIARFVGQEIRFNAWTFGTHGYEPFSAATIFERRFGDCKDKSILLRQLLAEIGVEAHPVLINAEYRKSEEKLDLALLRHFNHCIAYVPATAERAGYYLDATADRNPIEYLRADDQGAKVLHVRNGNGELVQIPYAKPEENAFVRDYTVELARDGSGQVLLEDTSTGMFGVQNRYQLGGEQGDLRQRLAQLLADAFGKVDVLEARTSKLEDIGVPAGVEARVAAQNLWTRESSGASLRSGFDEIPILGAATEAAGERQHDLVLDRPFELRSKVLYKLPEGARVKELPTDADISADGLCDYRMRVKSTPEGVEVERVFTLRERRIPRARYADFRTALDEIRSAEQRALVLEDLSRSEARPTEKK